MAEYVNSSDDPRSRLFGNHRLFDLDSLDRWNEIDLHPLWPSEERPDDPKAYIIRQVIETYLKPQHREVLEGYWFEGKNISQIAEERGVTRRAVRSMLDRAEASFKTALLEHYKEFMEVPEDER